MQAQPLPEPVRRRLAELAADTVGGLEPEAVPASLRPFARFAPARRRQAVVPLTTAVATDADFRAAVAERLRALAPDLVAAVESRAEVAAVDPVEVAAAAYLVRPDGWEERIAAVAAAASPDGARATAQDAQRRRQERAARAERERLTARVRELEAAAQRHEHELDRERRRAREAAERARVAERQRDEARAALAAAEHRAQQGAARAAAELAELRRRVSEAEDALERGRRDTREAREAADVRRWLLLDTLARTVAGLREELGGAPATRRPGDLVATPDAGTTGSGARVARVDADDPESLDVLLTLPNAHLVVDGYNVTKTGFADLPLEDQRVRLLTGLGALAARTGAEVTCVFDGAEVVVPVPAVVGGRRVRVRFSPPGQTADELIRRFVRAEPPGRPVVVCSADREVADGVRRAGAHVVTPRALLARLGRG